MERPTLESVVRALRRVNVQGSLFGQTIAIRLGLSESDVEALEILIDNGASTAGRLAELMGLTTGAVTRMIDRLEQAGFVRRVPDPADRRRVIVEPVPDRAARVGELIDGIAAAAARDIGRYSPDQLDAIGDFLERMAETTRAERERLRETPAAEGTDGSEAEYAAPVGGLRVARLLFRSGASEVTLGGDETLVDLYRARFEGPRPQVRLRDGVVSIQYRGGLFDWRRRRADISLNTNLDWSIEIRGGASNVQASLGQVRLREVDIAGGASKVELRLGRPTGEVPIRISAGASNVRIARPADAAIRLAVTGGAGKVELDDQRIGGTSEARLDSPGAATAVDRFLVEVTGGVSDVRIRSAT